VTVLKSIPRLVRGRILPALVALLIGLLVVFLAVGGFDDPTWADRFFGPAEKFRVLEFLGVAMGGVLLAIGAVIAHKRAVALEDAAKAQARAAEAQAGAATAQAAANKGAEDGRRQERLKNAIEHLGHASDSVRLGGAYELFHLAKDIDYLRQTVLDILCAHIRRTTGEVEYRKEHRAKPSEEIQSLLTLLFVREYATFKGCRIDLQGSWLNGAVLYQAHLRGADLSRTHLQGAELREAHLQGAELRGALLQGADLFRIHLQGAELFEAHLQGAYLPWAHLQGAELRGAHLQGAYLPWAHLQGAELRGAHLQGAELSAAHLQGTNLLGALLQGAYLRGALLQGAHLLGAHLQGAACDIYEPSFAARIRQRIDLESDLSRVTFAGGLSRENVDSLVKDMPGEKAEALRRQLKPHIDKPAIRGLPEGIEDEIEAYTEIGAYYIVSGVYTMIGEDEIGAYTEEEAERWIAEYEEAMRGVPKAERG